MMRPPKESRYTKYNKCNSCDSLFLVYKRGKSHKNCKECVPTISQKPYPKGYRFPGTKLTVFGHRSGNWGRDYRVICDCGKRIWAQANNLSQGRTKSCGCGAKAYRESPKTKRTNVPYAKGETGYFNTWQRVNILGWYFKDAEGTPLLVPPEVTRLKKYKEKVKK